jgi:hypothetical protein
MEIELVESANTTTFRVVTKNEPIPTVKLYFYSYIMSNDKSVTAHNTCKCSKIPSSASVHFSIRVQISSVACRC